MLNEYELNTSQIMNSYKCWFYIRPQVDIDNDKFVKQFILLSRAIKNINHIRLDKILFCKEFDFILLLHNMNNESVYQMKFELMKLAENITDRCRIKPLHIYEVLEDYYWVDYSLNEARIRMQKEFSCTKKELMCIRKLDKRHYDEYVINLSNELDDGYRDALDFIRDNIKNNKKITFAQFLKTFTEPDWFGQKDGTL